MSENKKIYLIGAGPGDPELITLKAIRALQESRVVLYDQLVNPEILEHIPSTAQKIFVGKSKGNHSVPQDEINAILVDQAKKFDIVSRLKGGDPFIFGRGGEEVEYLVKLGFKVEVIPGVTSASGAASSILLPLSHRRYASEVVLITGHKKRNGDYKQFDSYNFKNKTVIIYMGITALREISQELCKKSENCKVPVAIIENATLPGQRMVRGELGKIVEIAEKNMIKAPSLIIIGAIVKFLDDIDFKE